MNVVVIGAGAAGCTAAWELRAAGHQVELLERENEIGGRTRTLYRDGFEIDRGAAFITNRYSATRKLLKKLGKQGEIRRWKPSIGFRNGERIDYMKPDSMLSRLTFSPIDMKSGWRLTRAMIGSTPDNFDGENLANVDDGTSTAEWGPKAVGAQAYEYGVRTAVEPFWGAPPEDVPAAAARGVLGSSVGQKLLQVEGGTGSVAKWLAGDDFTAGVEVEQLEIDGQRLRVVAGDNDYEADAIVIATDAHVAADLLDGITDLNAELRDYSYAANLHVALGFDREVWPADAGDLVFEVGPGDRTITSYAPLSRRRPSGVPEGCELIDVYFGDRASRELGKSDAVSMSKAALEHHLDKKLPDPILVEVIYQPRALSAPRPGELAGRVELSLPENIALAGDHAAMASVETAVRSGSAAVKRLTNVLA